MRQPPEILLLAGGLGTRLHPLTEDLPKVLVPALGRPFLEHVLEYCSAQGFNRFVLSVGHLAGKVEAILGDGGRLGCEIRYVREEAPLGTGGAICRALSVLGETFLVVNGDTLLEVDLPALLRFHQQEGQALTLTAAWVEDRSRYGALQIQGHRVTAFEEKSASAGPGLINGGVCVMERRLLQGALHDAPFSLERQWLPAWLGRIAVLQTRGFFVDMGTHEALATLDADLAGFLAARQPV